MDPDQPATPQPTTQINSWIPFPTVLVQFAASELPAGSTGTVLFVGAAPELQSLFADADWDTVVVSDIWETSPHAHVDLVVLIKPTDDLLHASYDRLNIGGHVYFNAGRTDGLASATEQLEQLRAAGFAAAWSPAPVFLAEPLRDPERFDQWIFLGRRDI